MPKGYNDNMKKCIKQKTKKQKHAWGWKEKEKGNTSLHLKSRSPNFRVFQFFPPLFSTAACALVVRAPDLTRKEKGERA
jgi:hypothetical protein